MLKFILPSILILFFCSCQTKQEIPVLFIPPTGSEPWDTSLDLNSTHEPPWEITIHRSTEQYNLLFHYHRIITYVEHARPDKFGNFKIKAKLPEQIKFIDPTGKYNDVEFVLYGKDPLELRPMKGNAKISGNTSIEVTLETTVK
jgi:hypothetical protein